MLTNDIVCFGQLGPVLIMAVLAVAQSDVCLTGNQEVTGSVPARSGNILSWRLIMKYFLWSFSPFCCFKKGSCQFLATKSKQILVNRYSRGLSLPRKIVVR